MGAGAGIGGGMTAVPVMPHRIDRSRHTPQVAVDTKTVRTPIAVPITLILPNIVMSRSSRFQMLMSLCPISDTIDTLDEKRFYF